MVDVTVTLGRAVSSAVASIVTGKVKDTWDKKRLDASLKDIRREVGNARRGVSEISSSQAEALDTVLGSPKFAAVFERIALAKFLDGEGAGEARAEVFHEFYAMLRLHTNHIVPQIRTNVIDEVIDHIDDTISAFLVETKLSNLVPQKSLIRMIPSAAKHVMAAKRNGTILDLIDELAPIDRWVSQLCDQILVVHRNIRLTGMAQNHLVRFDELYVEPRFSVAGSEQPISTEEILLQDRCVILGNPGGGKSTFAQFLTLLAASGSLDSSKEDGAQVPFLVVVRDLAKALKGRNVSIVEFLERICRVNYSVNPPASAVEYLLCNSRALIIFDGMDEILQIHEREYVRDLIFSFASRYPYAKIVVTSRFVGYGYARLDAELFRTFRIRELLEDGVEQYVLNWFKIDPETATDRVDIVASEFLRESRLASDIRCNPLMLALMCTLYSHIGYIPTNRPEVYEQCSMLLFRLWDKRRGLRVPLPFESYLLVAIGELAYWIYNQQDLQAGVPRPEIVAAIASFLYPKRFELYDEAVDAADEFVGFCTERAWVLTDIGANKTESLYGFTHRTFLEYFTARRIQAASPSGEALFYAIGDYVERGESDVIAQIAVQLAGKAIPGADSELIERALDHAALHPVESHQNRNTLVFLCQLVSFLTPNAPTLRRLTEAAVAYFAAVPTSSHAAVDSSSNVARSTSPLHDLLEASSENLAVIARTLDDLLPGYSAEAVLGHVYSLYAYRPELARARWRNISGSVSYDHWRHDASQSRDSYDSYLLAAAKRPKWLQYYLFMRAKVAASQTFSSERLSFFTPDSPSCIRVAAPAYLIWAKLAEVQTPEVDLFPPDWRLTGDAANHIINAMLGTPQPWLILSSDHSSTIPEVALDVGPARAELWPDRRINGVYALVAVFCSDLIFAGDWRPSTPKASKRRDMFHRLTGDLFARYADYDLPVPTRVQRFIADWYSGSMRTVR